MPHRVTDTVLILHEITIYFVPIHVGTNLVTIALILLFYPVLDLPVEKPVCLTKW